MPRPALLAPLMAPTRQAWLQPLLLAALLTLLPLGLTACNSEAGSRSLGCATSPVPCLEGTAVVELQTSKGPVRLSVDGRHAPLTAGNFVDLVRRGVYNGTAFHRVVRQPKPFVVQGGDPSSADPKTPVSDYGTGSFIDPVSAEARLIPLELKLKTGDELRYGAPLSSASQISELELTHQRGALAMARSNDPNSASAQFYIALEALPELDGSYAVFGRVISGMDVVNRIEQGDRLIKATLLEGGTPAQKKP